MKLLKKFSPGVDLTVQVKAELLSSDGQIRFEYIGMDQVWADAKVKVAALDETTQKASVKLSAAETDKLDRVVRFRFRLFGADDISTTLVAYGEIIEE